MAHSLFNLLNETFKLLQNLMLHVQLMLDLN